MLIHSSNDFWIFRHYYLLLKINRSTCQAHLNFSHTVNRTVFELLLLLCHTYKKTVNVGPEFIHWY